ncbi:MULTISPECIES: DUF6153 family protein [unclassified Streptomyces]|uniref:DUF6153 family protein n=1 Tax=unclassified Streptomyces TaxID=2593676 RepID=UPI00093B5404|nr:DUF6153 family protein [Streptomyces sp. TSRI0107]OKJ88515.1 hypothetical protein AMK31_08565 [Streptomyces sp. TSRI0107]
MRAKRYVRAGGAFGQLLLVAALTLGVFVMHTLGHPEEHSGTAMSATSHAAPHDARPAAAPADPAAHSAATHEPPTGMDMLSLCVAVLFGAWALASLLRSAFVRHGEWLARLLGRLAAALRPNPPPRGPDLTQLSVLRL